MTEFEKVLMKRDGLTEVQAHEELVYARECADEVLQDPNGTLWEVEDILAEYGLEPDYIFDLLL